MSKEYFFENVTLLITHYNRSQSLESLLLSFKNLNCRFADIVVSDDGSTHAHIENLNELKNIYSFKLVTTSQNRGLGHNINKGQDAVKTALTLYVQEDFAPTNIFPNSFENAIGLMSEKPDLDIVRFYAYFEYPYLRRPVKGYYEVDFTIWKPGYQKFYVYSDHPHLRRTDFFNKFGRYIEGANGDVTEYAMMMSFLRNKGKAMFFKDFTSLFIQRNSEAEPSTMKRNIWRESDNFFLKHFRHLYRHLKFNLDYLK